VMEGDAVSVSLHRAFLITAVVMAANLLGVYDASRNSQSRAHDHAVAIGAAHECWRGTGAPDMKAQPSSTVAAPAPSPTPYRPMRSS
jgi:hypothetical protein